MYSNLFSPDSIAELTVAMQTQFPKAIWETFYVTLLSTALAVVIGLPLGVLLVAGEKGGVLPLPKALMSVLNVIITHQMSVVKEVCNHVAILDDGEVVEEGLVSAVFSAPKSAAARHLVFPRGADIDVSDPQQQRRIRLIFRSAKTTSIPLVARLATEEGISATVISANTQKLSEEVYGSMLLGVPNAQFEQAMDFLRSIENLQVEEASVDVQ